MSEHTTAEERILDNLASRFPEVAALIADVERLEKEARDRRDRIISVALERDRYKVAVQQVEAQRDDLLDALRAALPYLRAWRGLSVDTNEAIMRAAKQTRAAIEKDEKS